MSSEYPALDPTRFSDDDFLKANASFVDAYVALRARNVPSRQAMTRTFGPNQGDERVNERIRHMEATETYCAALERAIHGSEGVKSEWTASQSIWDLRELVNDPSVSAQARAGAIRELNLLNKITIVDESGKTRANDKPELLDMLAKLYPGFDLQTAKESFEFDLQMIAKSRQ